MNETSEPDAMRRRHSIDLAEPLDTYEESDCAFSDDNLGIDMDMEFDLAMPHAAETRLPRLAATPSLPPTPVAPPSSPLVAAMAIRANTLRSTFAGQIS
ncbi:hypothetical protein T069G_08605 [Trichoderma breve]|uniref:Uncharacterized protein n=1 Tax=Trichoderma breve TaxID=2034170 RepID=A0A9W9B6X9_9HYPO|nr:hypothetical protein T069G_08605 [Trichoderma breve]KAJ4857708.1 hypothetical protein T069G_08605 [Trichoderma breve]